MIQRMDRTRKECERELDFIQRGKVYCGLTKHMGKQTRQNWFGRSGVVESSEAELMVSTVVQNLFQKD